MNAKRNKKKRIKNIKNTINEYKPTKEELQKLNYFINKIEVKNNEGKN